MGVQRAIDHAHASRAQLGFDAIMPESFADHCRIPRGQILPRPISRCRILRSERLSYHLPSPGICRLPAALERLAYRLSKPPSTLTAEQVAVCLTRNQERDTVVKMLPGTSMEGAISVAERVRKAAMHMEVPGVRGPITVSL